MSEGTQGHAAQPATVLLVGYAKLPEGTAAQSLYGTVGVVLEVEVATGTILDASCTLVPEMAHHFVARILRGQSISDGVEGAVAEIAARYLGPSQGAIIAALRGAYSRWESYCSGGE